MMKSLAAKIFGLLIIPLFFIGTSAWALDEDRTVDQAMRALKKGDRDAAAETLEKALTERPDSASLNYHAGLVSYESGDFDLAKEHFAKALALRARKDEARANYNAGNSLFQGAKGLRATDPEQAIELLKEALNYYGRAIELNNADKDASYNHELTSEVIKLIKVMTPPPMPKPQGGGSKEEEKEKDQKQKQQQQQQEQEEQEQEEQRQKEQQQQQEEEQKEGPSGGLPEPDETDEEPKEKQAQAPHKEDLTEEEARMLVAAYGQEGPRLDINKDKHARDAKVFKNW